MKCRREHFAPKAYYSMALALRLSSQDVRVATHLHLVPRLRISGGIPPFTLHSFIVCIVTTNPFTEVTERSFKYSPLHILLKPPHFPLHVPLQLSSHSLHTNAGCDSHTIAFTNVKRLWPLTV